MSKEALIGNTNDTIDKNKSTNDFREERTTQLSPNKRQIKEKGAKDDSSSKKMNRSKLEDAINLSHLEKLKQKFKEHDQDDSNGLDIEEFEHAFRSILTRNEDLSKEEMKVMFMKIDTNCDGTVDWDEFCTYMLLEYKERQDMNYVNDTPFPNPFRHINNYHRDTIIGVGFLQALNRRNQDEDLSYSNTSGRFVTVDVAGSLAVWNTDMQPQKSLVLDGVKSSRGKKGKLILSLECMSNSSKIVVSTTNRELCFYDSSAGNYDLCFIVPGFENTITSLHYWYNSQNHNEAVLVFGDSKGQVGRLVFSSVQQGLFGADSSKKSSVVRRIMMHDIHMGRISGVRLVIQSVHKDWAKKVMYVPNYDAFISCSMDQETSLYFGNIYQTGEKKPSSSFSVYKGVNAFDVSKDYIVSGGLDTIIRVWHYSMTNKPTATMKGHSATVEHVMVSESTNSIISVSKDTVIKVWDLKDHVCLQTLSKLTFGVHPVTATFFHSHLHTLLIGSKNFNLGVLERTRKSTVKKIDVKSHQRSIRAALYNQNFNQIVSTSHDSMVCVWDLETGEKVIQFSGCHGNHEITAMTFDPTHRRLLTAAKDGSIKIWNFNNGALLGELQNVHSEEITDILCCKNTFVTGGWSRQLVVYTDSRGIEEEEPPRVYSDPSHSEDILSMCLYRSDMIAYSMYDGSIIVRNTGCDIVLNRLSAARCSPTGSGYAQVYYSPLSNTFPADNTPYGDSGAPTVLPAITPNHRISNVKSRRRASSVLGAKPVTRAPLTTARQGQLGEENQYDCSVDKLLFLSARPTAYNTATLLSGHNYCMVRAWSTQGGGLLGQFSVSDIATSNDSLLAMTTNPSNTILIAGDTLGYVSVYVLSAWCNSMPGIPRISSNNSIKQPAPRLDGPPQNSKFRCHLRAITHVELVPTQDLIVTSSTDCSIRVWTLAGNFIGTFGQGDVWRTRPVSSDGSVLNLPEDIKNSMSEDQLLKLTRRKRILNPWRNVKNIMTFAHVSHSKDSVSIDEQLSKDPAYQPSLDSDKSNILGRAYHRHTRPRLPWMPVAVGQECGSILAYSQLDRKNMRTDPTLPAPPNYMKLQGREALPKFYANSLDMILDEERRNANLRSGLEEEADEELEEELIGRSKKYNEKNLFPLGFENQTFLRNILNVKKAAKRFGKKNTGPRGITVETSNTYEL